MQFNMTVNMDGAVFHEDALAHILRDLATTLNGTPGARRGVAFDRNGNTVGHWSITGEEDHDTYFG